MPREAKVTLKKPIANFMHEGPIHHCIVAEMFDHGIEENDGHAIVKERFSKHQRVEGILYVTRQRPIVFPMLRRDQWMK